MAAPASAEVFMYRDAAGNILLTDAPRQGMDLNASKGTLLASAKYSYSKSKPDRPSRKATVSTGKVKHYTRYNALIKKSAKRYKLDPKLVSAVIQVESQFNASAVSHSGAVGLMQLMPSTAKQLGVSNRYDPSQNIEGGTKYLRYLIQRFDGNLTYALAGYNAGPLNVEKHEGIPPFKETQRYVKKIFSIYKGGKTMNLADRSGNTISRYKLEDGTVVYTNEPRSNAEKF